MRQIGTLTSEQAHRFADFLRTLEIKTQLIPEGDSQGIWICDEDRVGRARDELAEFQRDPDAIRYIQSASKARQLRQKEAETEEAYNERQQAFNRAMDQPRTRCPLTFALIVISVLVTVFSDFGAADSPVTQALSIAPYTRDGNYITWKWLNALTGGELWRAVTPIFLHFTLLHIIFNMIWLYQLGGAIEVARGTWKLLLLVLLIAVGSNLGEYYLTWTWDPDRSPGLFPVVSPSPTFGGMSGVVYGLFGYLWMKGRFEPELGIRAPRETVWLMLAWFFICMTGMVGPIANVGHGGGLLIGVLLGLLPQLWLPWLRRG